MEKGLEIKNNPVLASITLLVETAANEMINPQDQSRFFKVIPDHLMKDYLRFFKYMRAFGKHAHSGLGSQDLYAEKYSAGSLYSKMCSPGGHGEGGALSLHHVAARRHFSA